MSEVVSPVLTLTDLLKEPDFGRNKVKSIMIESIQTANILNAEIVPYQKTRRIRVHLQNVVNDTPRETKFNYVVFDKENADVVGLFEKLENGTYHSHGVLDPDLFRIDWEPIEIARIEKELAYGTDPELISVSDGGGDMALVIFKTKYNGKWKQHAARWFIPDLDKGLGKIILVPKSIYDSNESFIKLVAEALKSEPSRFRLEDDATLAKDSIRLYSNDALNYGGYLTINLINYGSEVKVFDDLEVLNAARQVETLDVDNVVGTLPESIVGAEPPQAEEETAEPVAEAQPESIPESADIKAE